VCACAAGASAVALPSPLVAPVTTIVLPVKSGRSAAVQFVTVMRDSWRRFGYACWMGHHGTATALHGATSQTAGATRNTGYSLTICAKSASGARRVIGKNGSAVNWPKAIPMLAPVSPSVSDGGQPPSATDYAHCMTRGTSHPISTPTTSRSPFSPPFKADYCSRKFSVTPAPTNHSRHAVRSRVRNVNLTRVAFQDELWTCSSFYLNVGRVDRVVRMATRQNGKHLGTALVE
jgi:hypothetical protein